LPERLQTMTTLVHKLSHWARERPDQPALHRRTASGWEAISWRQYLEAVQAVGDSLVALDIEAGDSVTILSNNRVEWLYVQFGATVSGAVATPCYATCPPDQLAYQVAHSRAPIVFAENCEQLAKLIQIRQIIPRVRQVVVFDEIARAEIEGCGEWVLSFEEFLRLGQGDGQAAELRARRFASLASDDPAFNLYTSGTTGKPKGVVLTHANLTALAPALLGRFRLNRSRMISYLPLAHIGEQFATNLTQMETGGEVFVCRDPALVRDCLPEVRPNVIFGVPRIWEKVESALRARFADTPPLQRALLRWAMGAPIGRRSWRRSLGDRLVLAGIRRRLGFANLDVAMSGAAPIHLQTLRFFESLGVRIHEVYGLSETCGVLTSTRPGDGAAGTVGTPLAGVDIKLAEDGEILCKSPGNTSGYLHSPEATARLFEDGWLKTGDTGELDEDGNLTITGRKTELMITAGGKNVAPQPIEALLEAIPEVSQAVVIGDRRPYLVALLTVDEHAAEALSERLEIDRTGGRSPAYSDRFRDYLSRRVEEVNRKLARHETIKRFAVVASGFTLEGGELTPTLKIRRQVVATKHEALIESIYGRRREAGRGT